MRQATIKPRNYLAKLLYAFVALWILKLWNHNHSRGFGQLLGLVASTNIWPNLLAHRAENLRLWLDQQLTSQIAGKKAWMVNFTSQTDSLWKHLDSILRWYFLKEVEISSKYLSFTYFINIFRIYFWLMNIWICQKISFCISDHQ